VVEAEQVDAPSPGQDQAAPETAAGAAVDDLGAYYSEKPYGEVSEDVFNFKKSCSHWIPTKSPVLYRV
jgi:hypothetical protein